MPSLLVLLTVVHPFVTDGCTLFPEGTPRNPKLWEECCLEHDLRLWAGGTRVARKKTDRRLGDCVAEKGEPVIGKLMYWAVHVASFSPKKIKGKEWGNAWEVSGYRKLQPAEVEEIKAELPKYSIPRDIELRFIADLEADLKTDAKKMGGK